MRVAHALPHEHRDARWVHLRETIRESLWFLPALFTLAGLGLGTAVNWLDQVATAGTTLDMFTRNVEDVRSVVSTIAVSLLTFLAVVFSITIVVLQLASSQYSPRVLRRFIRSRWTQVTLAMFMATFAYSLTVLSSIDSTPGADGGRRAQALGAFVAQVLALTCLFLFIAFVHQIITSLRVARLLEEITDETRRAIEENFPPASAYVEVDVEVPTEVTARTAVDHVGVIRAIEIDRLVDLAMRHGTVIRLRHMVGDYLAEGEPVVEICGGTLPTRHELHRCFDIGFERNLYQDAPYGFRQLVDIAIKALSPALNDPTTAVQVVDRLVDLLRRIGLRPTPTGVYLGPDGTVRLVRPMPTWPLFVDLAFTEIRRYGDDSPQISRRLQSAFDELLEVMPEDRDGAIERQQNLLRQRVERAVHDPTERAHALEPDPRGLG